MRYENYYNIDCKGYEAVNCKSFKITKKQRDKVCLDSSDIQSYNELYKRIKEAFIYGK